MFWIFMKYPLNPLDLLRSTDPVKLKLSRKQNKKDKEENKQTEKELTNYI